MRNYLIGTEFKFGKFAERGLKRADKFGLQLSVKFVASVFVRYVSANIRIEKQGIRYFIRINARAAHRNIHVKTYFGIDNSERNGIRRSELVVYYLFKVEIINSLVFARIAAVSKTFAYRFECFLNALTEASRKNARFGGRIVCKLSRLGTDFDNLALLNDYHTLTVGNGYTRTVGNYIVVSFRVRGTPRYLFLSFYNKNFLIYCLTVEKFFPLIRKSSAESAYSGFDKSHSVLLLFRLYYFNYIL